MTPTMWKILGFLGQGVFASRFIVQWLMSERRGRSYIPRYFWYASIVGSTVLFSYAVHIKDPVFILGQSMGMIIYYRNLVLLRRSGAEEKAG